VRRATDSVHLIRCARNASGPQCDLRDPGGGARLRLGSGRPRTEGNRWFPSVTSFPLVMCRTQVRHAVRAVRFDRMVCRTKRERAIWQRARG
jgi:hypothetical protein